MSDSINRFSRTVENYVRYRPGYPQAMVEFLQAAIPLTEATIIADIGSGTGLLAEAFLRSGHRVVGVEPNQDMRLASQHLLRGYPRFSSIAATAESTTLAPQSVDLITVGQAFQFFDRDKTRQEFARILRPDGWVVLVRLLPRQTTPFLVAYDRFWRKYVDPQGHGSGIDTQSLDQELRAWYAPGTARLREFDAAQSVDDEGLRGRVLSSSKAPAPGQPQYPAMLEELDALFQRHQVQGKVAIEYECRVIYGRFS